MPNPLISVMIPVYNREKYIKEAVDSVIAQDYRPLEIIVVDDGSTDKTAEIIKQYDPEMVKYFYQENTGHAKARNVCVEKSKGEYLAWLDSDDYYLPGKLTAQMDYLREHPECEIVFTLFENFYENETARKIAEEKRKIFPSFTGVGNLDHATMLARRAMILRVGGRNETLKIHEDIEWLCRVCIIHKIVLSHCIERVYYRRRFHENNIAYSNVSKETVNSLYKTYYTYMRSSLRNQKT